MPVLSSHQCMNKVTVKWQSVKHHQPTAVKKQNYQSLMFQTNVVKAR